MVAPLEKFVKVIEDHHPISMAEMISAPWQVLGRFLTCDGNTGELGNWARALAFKLNPKELVNRDQTKSVKEG